MTDPRCRSGDNCVNRTPEGAAITTKANTICSACVDDIQKCLGALPILGAALRTFLGGIGGGSGEARVGGTKEPPSPLNVHVLDQVDALWDALDYAGGPNAHIRDLINQPAEEWLLGGRRVMRDGVDRALEIRRVHAKAVETIGLNKIWSRRAAPCPECHLPMLGNYAGEDIISCTNPDCLARFTREEYDAHCVEQSKKPRKRKA